MEIRINIIFLALLYLFLSSCNGPENVACHHLYDNEVVFHLWQIDSCGRLGHRRAIHDYLFLEKEVDIVGETDVLSIFPIANEVTLDSLKNQVRYKYLIENFTTCDMANESVARSMYINVDVNSKKIVNQGWSMH